MTHLNSLSELSRLDELKPFGRSTSSVFTNLDQLRRLQINLALEHLRLESLPAEGLTPNDIEKEEDSSRRFKRNAERFAKKEVDVNNLMLKLEELSEAMRSFHDSSEGFEQPRPASNPVTSNPTPRSSNPTSRVPSMSDLNHQAEPPRISITSAAVERLAASAPRSPARVSPIMPRREVKPRSFSDLTHSSDRSTR